MRLCVFCKTNSYTFPGFTKPSRAKHQFFMRKFPGSKGYHCFLLLNIMNDLYDISYAIRGAIFRVHNGIGPGLLEIVYEAALKHELSASGLIVNQQVGVPVFYKEIDLGIGFRIDLLVEDRVLIEIKSVENLSNLHKKQLLTYLKLAKKKLGILVNFNAAMLVDKDSLIRIIN